VKQQEKFAQTLSAISRRVSKLQTGEICCGAMTFEQFETLRAIEASRDPSMSVLSAALRVDISTMSRNVSVLEREKYVSRVRAQDDSRIVTVLLTPKGRNALETLRCDEREVMANVYRKIPMASRAAILETLSVLQAALESDDLTAAEACCADEVPKRAVR
jgi:DNA-binding MarR family transcriptional regulator